MPKYPSWKKVRLTQKSVWNEMDLHFWKIHGAHVRAVKNNLILFANAFNSEKEMQEQIWNRVMHHDDSKTKAPEYVPYVWRYWKVKCLTEGVPENLKDSFTVEYFKDPSLDQEIRDGIFHHITHNRHHPEWHPDHDDMNMIDIIEMVCDWYAVSKEYGTNIDDWVKDVVPRRYHFGKTKKQMVLKTIAKMKQLDKKI